MRDAALDRMLRRGECLSQDLPTKDLGAADIAAIAAEYIVFDALELEELDQVGKDGMHALRTCRGRRRPGYRCR